MNKEQKLGLLKCIGYLGFHETFTEIKMDDYDVYTQTLINNYLIAYNKLSEHVGFPEDLELLEKETIM